MLQSSVTRQNHLSLSGELLQESFSLRNLQLLTIAVYWLTKFTNC
ncbi:MULTISPECIES: hypothetical protein [Spirulina sp. CCY15215]|nr:hypothetical protein [Spirulina major]